MKYRAEIDGLRALAVVPVILFHAGFDSFSGGFVGVDVFFVISGYLITTIILSEKEKGTFSLVNFYERRARRILPALFLVMLSSLPFAWLWLTPSDMKDFSQSLIATSFFVSNILFLSETGYWGVANELKPLLHTWSLAVEEQYYLIFPLLVMLIWRFHRRWVLISFLAIFTTSLFIAHWAAYNSPTANFFLLPTRGWELAIGASIAFYFLYGKRRTDTASSRSIAGEIFSAVGLLMIAYAVFVFDETVPFPSLFALVPTVGAGLIILFSSAQTVVGQLLGSRLLVGIGLISYSAYLWHQPLFAFARNRSLAEPNDTVFMALAIMVLPLAYLSWRYVEKPFRTQFSRKSIFRFALIGSMIFVVIGVLGEVTDGFESRYSDKNKALLSFLDYDRSEAYREGVCFLAEDQTYSAFDESCFASSGEGDSIVLWGDSHAGALSYGFLRNFHNVVQLTASSCTPLVGYDPIKVPECIGINDFVLDKIADLKPKLLFIHANWSHPINEIEVGLNEALSSTLSRVKSVSPETNIVIVGGVPHWRPSLPILLAKFDVELNDEVYVRSSEYKKIQHADQELKEVATSHGVTFISLLDIFCNGDECLSSAKLGDAYEPFAWDYGHLTKFSSSLVAKEISLRIEQGKGD